MAASKKLIIFLLLFGICPGTKAQGQKKAQNILTSYTVSKDGTADFQTIQAAINAVRDFSDAEVTIHIKKGIYKEKLIVPSWKTNVFLLGEDSSNTVISNGDYSGKEGFNTYNSYTLLIQGNDFRAERLTIENSAGPVGQAVALHAEGDRIVVKNCRILGNQDTLFPAVDTSRQYYLDCYIEGTTDFIFGAATVVFERCHIHSKKNSYITAASTTAAQRYGFVFIDCKLRAAPGIEKVYLGRPWRPYANTVFIHTDMGPHILAAGWRAWNENDNHKSSYYAEYGSKGQGGISTERISWSKQLSKQEVKGYTLEKIFSGNSLWKPKQ
ncbi:pectin esterase [Pedobacter sp. N36a]|uniref:pectinesterase family protein n=1 Tax=Pedobacter sp. N36a TaxID=2767996 RepID=UPI0016573FE6|nr:pectinesterase family protein [Pedobacter sp. N36a]MBC8985119.1 pectin esterase [Pedobacter sp. N36a]